MKRTAVFAHYDKNNLIQDYVVYYLSELKKCAEKIIFVSDSDVLPEELKKIEGIVEQSIIGRLVNMILAHTRGDFCMQKKIICLPPAKN